MLYILFLAQMYFIFYMMLITTTIDFKQLETLLFSWKMWEQSKTRTYESLVVGIKFMYTSFGQIEIPRVRFLKSDTLAVHKKYIYK